MKKLIFLLSFVTLLSCSSSDDNSSNNNSSNSKFHPPAWIQGKWMSEISVGYKFTSDNVCTVMSTTETCLKEMVEQYNTHGTNATVNESIVSGSEYKFSYTVQSVTQTFHFIKINNTKIELVNPTDGLPNTPLIKQ